jgi:hypothetical protein
LRLKGLNRLEQDIHVEAVPLRIGVLRVLAERDPTLLGLDLADHRLGDAEFVGDLPLGEAARKPQSP